MSRISRAPLVHGLDMPLEEAIFKRIVPFARRYALVKRYWRRHRGTDELEFCDEQTGGHQILRFKAFRKPGV
jgi:hypothetical protein